MLALQDAACSSGILGLSVAMGWRPLPKEFKSPTLMEAEVGWLVTG